MIQELLQHPDFLIVNKPAGVSCHNDPDSVIQKYGKEWHLANRLEKENSGLLVITKNSKLQNSIQNALSEGEKIYSAVMRGSMPLSDSWNEWNTPISDQGEGRDNPQGKSVDWKDSKTLYKVVKSNQYFSLLECQLITGRQHQIRKHSLLAGRPIVGDSRYGNLKDNQRISQKYGFDRLALHAWKIRFNWNEVSVSCESPIPASFQDLFST